MSKIFKFLTHILLLIRPYDLPLPSWVTIDYLSSIYKGKLVPIRNIHGYEEFHLKTKFDSIFNIITILSINGSIDVKAGALTGMISRFFSIFFLVFLAIGVSVLLQDRSSSGRFLIIILLGFVLLTILVNFVHLLQYLLLRKRITANTDKYRL